MNRAPHIRRSALSIPLALVLLASCANDLSPNAPDPDGDIGASDTALVEGVGGLAFVSITHNRSYENGVLLAVRAPANTARVDYFADGKAAGTSSNPAGGFGVVVTVANPGYVVVAARAQDANGKLLGEVQAGIVLKQPVEFGFVSPEREGGSYANGVWFKTRGPADVVKVRYTADGWPLGESTDIAGEFPVRYTFTSVGRRTVLAEAFDIAGNRVDKATRSLVVVDETQGSATPTAPVPAALPYFYQYANQLAPGATCQNTSIAMVLAAFGWRGRPDDITAEFGRTYAQSPAGLASLFNTLARRAGISARLQARTAGTLAGLRTLVNAGKPTIVHGFFTSFGHVLVVTGFDGTHYTVHDPAGTWNQAFGGGYPHGWEPTAGRGIRYPKAAFERAIGTYDGGAVVDGSLWYHELQ